jgi:CubicO group peptidase (beta-lactamase class C family)
LVKGPHGKILEMSARKVDDLLHELRDAKLAPDLTAATCRLGERPRTFGETLKRFDLASVTKSMFAVAFARLAARESSRDLLHAELGSLLEEARGTPGEHVLMEQLLAHRAGFAGHVALWLTEVNAEVPLPFDPATRRAALVRAASARRDDEAPVYSDLGYLLAGEAAARAAGLGSAGELIEREVVQPLALEDELGTAATLAARGALEPVAPTEDVAFRGGTIRGSVHDENAFAFAGAGGAGHAGMFGTARAVAVFGEAVLAGLLGAPSALGRLPGWLVAPRPGGTLRAGFDGKSESGSSAGSRFGPRSFGHLGFTGTSLWIDPDARVVAVLLTNRVCPTRESVPGRPSIREARPRVNDLLYAVALEGEGRLEERA